MLFGRFFASHHPYANLISDMPTCTKSLTCRIGFDLGNTIVRKGEPIPDAFRVIRRLIDEKFGDHSYIISKVNKDQEVRARAFVNRPDFKEMVGIPIERIHFCRERHEKGPICRRLELTHFVDDRPQVMVHMPDSVTHRILFQPDWSTCQEFQVHLHTAFTVRSWKEIEALLLG